MTNDRFDSFRAASSVVRVTIKGATLEVQDTEHAARFVEREGEVVRVSSV